MYHAHQDFFVVWHFISIYFLDLFFLRSKHNRVETTQNKLKAQGNDN